MGKNGDQAGRRKSLRLRIGREVDKFQQLSTIQGEFVVCWMWECLN